MTATEKKIGYKKRIQQACIDIIKERIAATAMAMENAQVAANSEEKSSAGDKYETSRAMSHIEKDMYAGQLAATRRELAQLMDIDCSVLYEKASKGSLVICDHASFFIAAGIGRVSFEGQDIFVLSPAAPIAKLLFDKKPGEMLAFNNKELTILSIS